MSTIVILKNTTGANLTFKGIVIKHFIDRDHGQQVDTLCGNPDIEAAIAAGDIVVNDGTNDLSAAKGLLHLCAVFYADFTPPVNLTSINFAGSGFGGYADVMEFGETGNLKNKFIRSSYSDHTSLDSTAIALADGRIIHATFSTEAVPEDNWVGQIVAGASKDGGSGGIDLEEVKGTTKLDVAGTYDDSGKDNGTFDPVDLTSDAVFDGVPTITAFANGDRILIKDQTDAKQNGIYDVKTAGATGKLERSSDFDDDNEVIAGSVVSVSLGTTHGGTSWELDNTGDLNVIDIDWSLYFGPPLKFCGGIQVGTDLEKPAGVLDTVFTDLTGFEFSAGDRISFYVEQGQIGAGEAVEPVVRLFVQYD